MSRPLDIVVLGLSLSSSWGNGHATTYRALLRAFAARGHRILFLERDMPWYRGDRRDLAEPDFCELAFYDGLGELARWRDRIAAADAVIIGSYVPQGIGLAGLLRDWTPGVLAFYDIDTPVTLARLQRGDCDYLSPALIPDYDLYLSFTGGPTLRLLEESYGAPCARPLYCSVDAEAYAPVATPTRWDLSYLGTYSDDRQPGLERLLLQAARQAPGLRFAVAGAQYPDGIDWPANVERLEHVPPAAHPEFYSASRYTLNITRADMIAAGFSPSVRLFEAAACGTPLLSDLWDGIETILSPPEEIRLVRDTAAVLAVLAQPEAARQAQAGAARRRVLASHTARHRAAELEAALRERRADGGRLQRAEGLLGR
ncbi:glycosyltransferase [Pseudoroseomonas deserti]|uniref:Glycosyltransferase n=1 Tax=Teichococcus deserti TaxID=1817963 RepID=A0A1V2H4Z0_9PROT|nr:glycosyltransferase [Pseudoroseomonas deserti]ONG56114.1 glycosyltransferase [Pseudoroseomonas deserti]